MLLAVGQDLNVIGIIAIILLIGIVKKNGIMLVDFAIVAERERNMPPIAAIREACLLRFRPILMTTAAALLAGLPMMFGHGTGSELRRPLGYSMVGDGRGGHPHSAATLWMASAAVESTVFLPCNQACRRAR